VIETVQPTLFDYSSLDTDVRIFVQDKAQSIHARLKRTAEDIIAIGQDLIEVKARLGHGQFLPWLQSEFGMSRQTSHDFMRVAERFGDECRNFLHLPVSILYELAAPSTPDAVIEMVETKQIPATLSAIREAKREYQEPIQEHISSLQPTLPEPNYSSADNIPPSKNDASVNTYELSRTQVFDAIDAGILDVEVEDEDDEETEEERYQPSPQEEIQPSEPQPKSTYNPVYRPTFEQWQRDNIALGLDAFADPIREEVALPVKSATLMALQSSESNEWFTPAQYVNAARELMGNIDIDPASNALANEVIQATNYYDIDTNGLDKQWTGRVWLNPPYGRDGGGSNQEVWSHRLIEQYNAGLTIEAVLLVNANTEAKWFQPLYDYLICFTNHRIRFYNTNGESSQPTQGNALVYLGKQRRRFIELFNSFGVIVRKVHPDEQ
jgi:hypothetical protein